jgi:hypothetical protein
MSRSNRFLVPVLAAAGLAAGCADYLNRYDTVTLAAGDAQKQNMLLHTADPFNPASRDTRIGTDGGRAADAVIRYKTSQQPGAPPPANITLHVGTATGQ